MDHLKTTRYLETENRFGAGFVPVFYIIHERNDRRVKTRSILKIIDATFTAKCVRFPYDSVPIYTTHTHTTLRSVKRIIRVFSVTIF